jgi:hypothetical protein
MVVDTELVNSSEIILPFWQPCSFAENAAQLPAWPDPTTTQS